MMDKLEKVLFKFLFLALIFFLGSVYGYDAGMKSVKEWEERSDNCLFCQKDKDLSWDECLAYCNLKKKEKEKIKKEKEIRLDVPVQLQFELWDLTPEQKYWAKEIFYQCKKADIPEPECRLLVKIAWCESKFDDNAIHINSDGTIDYGLFQLNSYWWDGWKYREGKTNIKKALEIYQKVGIEPWERSQKCWGKIKGLKKQK